MQKKLLIPILVVLLLVIVLMVRGCGNKDASQDDKQDETQDVQTDTFDNTNTTGNDVRTELGTMTANENGGVDITVTADGPQTTYTYTDVAPDAWYANAVNYVVSTGVMSGDDTQHLFQPEYGVERSQFAVIMYRFAGGTPTEEDAEFSDLTGDEWYYEYVKWMVGKGLMGGNGGAFDPSGFLSGDHRALPPRGRAFGHGYARRLSLCAKSVGERQGCRDLGVEQWAHHREGVRLVSDAGHQPRAGRASVDAL